MNKFINPYNFISIDEKVDRKSINDRMIGANLTGYIDCVLSTLTPIFIPNTSNDNAFGKRDTEQKKSYDFFSYDNLVGQDQTHKFSRPIIPGSSLRGPVRAAFEAAFNGCLSQVDRENRDTLYRRMNAPKTPGLLKYDRDKNSWSLYSAERVMMKVDFCNRDPDGMETRWEEKKEETGSCAFPNAVHFKTGTRVFVKKSARTYVTQINNRDFDTRCYMATKISQNQFSGSSEGYVLNGQIFSRKHHNSIMIPGPVVVREVPKEAIDRLDKVWALYDDSTVNKTHKGYRDFKECYRDKKPTPIFYTEVAGNLYLSPACITKEVYVNTILGLLEKQDGHQPCESTDDICEACALFGLVNDSGESLTSRIAFHDAFPCDEDGKELASNEWKSWFCDPRWLPELSKPKPSSVEFYTRKPEANGITNWNFDYAEIGRNQDVRREKIDLKLRGRKMYWHSVNQVPGPENDKSASIRHSFVRAVNKDKRFSARITFHDLTEKELNRLLWTLTLGDKKAHKIGRGKPIGMGSVKIDIKAVKTRSYVLKDGITVRDISEYSFSSDTIMKTGSININSKRIKELMTISAFPGPGTDDAPVRYPWDGTHTENYKWFAENRRPQNTMHGLPMILPADGEHALPCVATQINSNNNNGQTGHRYPGQRDPRPQNNARFPNTQSSRDRDNFNADSPFKILGEKLEDQKEKK